MNELAEIGARDGWRCWLCDEPVDEKRSVNDARGPSVDSRQSDAKSKANKSNKGGSAGKDSTANRANRGGNETTARLAHRGCKTKKGAVEAVIPWPSRLFVSDPAPLMGVAERLSRKGGREVVARCPTRKDADETADWLVDRFSRLVQDLDVKATVESGGGQYLVALIAGRRR